MYYQSFESKKKRGRRVVWTLAVLGLLGGAGVAAYVYGPQLYYSLTGDALVRLEKRSAEFEARLAGWDGDNAAIPGLLAELDEIRRIAEIQERNSPASAYVYYYQGLLDFYELIVRVPLNGPSLMQLTGRGYLPLQKSMDGLPEIAIPKLSQRIARHMRKALALDPGFAQRDSAYLVLVYGDLFFTERTDENLRLLLSEHIIGGEVSPGLERYRDWIGLALFALSGRKQELQNLVQAIEAATNQAARPAGATEGADAEQSAAVAAAQNRLNLDENVRDLVLCHGYYFARDYLPALRLAREVKNRPDAPEILRVEAVRMEGEIFLLQRGPAAACFFFEEAARMGDDDFVTERINTICAAP